MALATRRTAACALSSPPNAGMSSTHDKPVSSGAARAVAAVEATVDLLYRAPLWLPNRHVQTIVPSLFGRRPDITFRRDRWDTPDGDFIDLDWVVHDGQPAAALAPASPPQVPADD